MSEYVTIHIIGAGLAGSEAAWQAANAGARVILHEMRPVTGTDAHQTGGFAELVCSNSFRSDDAETNAVGLLHEEMRRAGSLIMREADASKVPAGGALAVDRDAFSDGVTRAIESHQNIEIRRELIDGLPPGFVARAYPTIARLCATVDAHPKVQEWKAQHAANYPSP